MAYNYDYSSSSDSSSDTDIETSEGDVSMGGSVTQDSGHTQRSESLAGDYQMQDASDSQSHSAQSALSGGQFSAIQSEPSSMTSYEHDPSTEPSEEGSPAASVISISDFQADIYREEHGRSINNYCDVYRLPADEEEWDRLEKQHKLLVNIMRGKYPSPMVDIMSSNIEGGRHCLDLGCGSGCWAKDVARDFPNCITVAVDLVPISDISDMPPNLRCEVDDINLGLQHFYGRFDVVHCRLISAGIKDYRNLIEDIARTLRPGGLINIADADYYVYDANHRRIEVTTDRIAPPWFARWMCFMRAAIQHSGGDADASFHFLTWITDHEAFEEVVYREFWLPIVPAADHNSEDPIVPSMKADVMVYFRSARPLLLGSGLPENVLDTLEHNAVRELHESEEPQYTRHRCVYARRTDIVLDQGTLD